MSNVHSTLLKDKILTVSLARNLEQKHDFLKACEKFIADNDEALFAPYPSIRVVCTKLTEAQMFKAAGVDPDGVGAIIASTGLNDARWFQRNRPIFTLLMLAQNYYMKKGKYKEQKLVLLTLAIIIYGGRQAHFFKFNSGTAFNNIMEYTVNNLSNKFLLKQYGTVYASLEAIMNTMIDTYRKNLMEIRDKDILDFIMNTVTRVHNFVKKLAQQFYMNRDKGYYANSVKSTDEEDGRLLDRDNVSAAITDISYNATLALKTSQLNQKLINIVSRPNQIGALALRSALEKCVKQEKNDTIQTIYADLLTIFLVEEKGSRDDICSPKFPLVTIKTYTQSHTTNKSVLRIKDNLEAILTAYSKEFNMTQRAATKGNFKKALFMYFSSSLQIFICQR